MTVPHVNLSIGSKEQEKGKEKEKVDIIGGSFGEWRVSLSHRCHREGSSGRSLRASGAGTEMVLKIMTVEECPDEGVEAQDGAKLVATDCKFGQNKGLGMDS